MFAPSKLKKPAIWTGIITLTALVSVLATLYVTTPQGDVVAVEDASTAEYEKAYQLVTAVAEGTSLVDCVDMHNELKVGSDLYFGGLGSLVDVKNPTQGAQALLARCAYQVSDAVYDEVVSTTPRPYYDDAYSGIDIEMPEEYRSEFPQWYDCYSNKKLEAGLQCVVGELGEFESNIETFVEKETSANSFRWQQWNNKWAHPPATTEVAVALDELRQIIDLEPNIDAEQQRLTLELCKSEGFSRDAALRLAIERRLTDFHEEPGVAANVIYKRYLEVKEYSTGICYKQP